MLHFVVEEEGGGGAREYVGDGNDGVGEVLRIEGSGGVGGAGGGQPLHKGEMKW